MSSVVYLTRIFWIKQVNAEFLTLDERAEIRYFMLDRFSKYVHAFF